MAGNAGAAAQVAANGGDQGEVLDHLDLQRLDLLLDIGDQRVERILHIRSLHHGGKLVHAGGHVLDGDAVALEDGQGAAHEADAALGTVAGDVDRKETALAGDAGDDGLGIALLGGLGDDGAGVLRRVGVLDNQRNARVADREDGLLVQHGRAHVGELAQLLVGDARNGLRALDDARVCGQKARDVRPVLVQVRLQALGQDGAGDISAAAIEQLDLALLSGTVEAGHDKAALAGVLLDQLGGALHG